MAYNQVDGDSFDFYNGAGGVTATTIGLGAGWTNNGAAMIAGRFGGQAVRMSEGSGSAESIVRTLDTNLGPYFSLHFAFRVSTVSAGGQFARMRLAGTNQVTLNLNTVGGFTVNGAGGVLITTPNNVLIANTWHSVECKCFMDNAGDIEVAVDGISAGSATGVDTLSGATAEINQIVLESGNIAGSGSTWDFDDYMLGSTYDFCGPSTATSLRPNADAHAGFTRSTGTANYETVDETLSNADVDYNEANTIGLYDLFDLPALGLVPAAIHSVNLLGFGRTTDAQARSISLDVDASQGANQALTSTYTKKQRLMVVNPATGLPWQVSEIDAMQIGYGLRV